MGEPPLFSLPLAGAGMTETIETRAVVTWEGPGEPIMLTLYGPYGEVALPLLPKRALTLAQELLTRGVQAIKADTWDAMYEPAAPQRAPDLARLGMNRIRLVSRA